MEIRSSLLFFAAFLFASPAFAEEIQFQNIQIKDYAEARLNESAKTHSFGAEVFGIPTDLKINLKSTPSLPPLPERDAFNPLNERDRPSEVTKKPYLPLFLITIKL